MDNKWINSADLKNWYLETYPWVTLTEKKFSIRDIFINLDKMPGCKLAFTKVVNIEEDD